MIIPTVFVFSIFISNLSCQTIFGSDLGLSQPNANITSPSLGEPLQKMKVVDGEQRIEFPILNPKNIDPNLLMVCDDLLSPDDIYTGLMSVLVRVEDTLRRNKCDTSIIQIHDLPIMVHSLLGPLKPLPMDTIRKHPIIGTYVDTMTSRSAELVKQAESCKLDYRLLMKIVRLSMKLLVDRISCGYVKIDVLRNKFGLPSQYGCKLGADQDGKNKTDPSVFGVLGMGYTSTDTGNLLPINSGTYPYSRYGQQYTGKYPNWSSYQPAYQQLPGLSPILTAAATIPNNMNPSNATSIVQASNSAEGLAPLFDQPIMVPNNTPISNNFSGNIPSPKQSIPNKWPYLFNNSIKPPLQGAVNQFGQPFNGSNGTCDSCTQNTDVINTADSN